MVVSCKRAARVFSLVLAILLCLGILSTVASAEGSAYISNYVTNMAAGSSGKVTVWYQITGTEQMDEIGAIKIVIYENGTQVKTYKYTDTAGMMSYNIGIHGGGITYSGIVGKTYYAHVTYQAGKDGGWDNRSVDTNTVTAKN